MQNVEIVKDALKQTNNRVVILSGWSEVERQSSDDILYLNSVHHDWLLPRCKMIIHHGGAGAACASLHAGIPNVVVPFIADQPFLGKRVHATGDGLKPILVENLSVKNLTQAIVESDDKIIRKRVRVIGQRIRGEGGVASAVNLIESHVSSLGNFKVRMSDNY